MCWHETDEERRAYEWREMYLRKEKERQRLAEEYGATDFEKAEMRLKAEYGV